MIPNSESPTRTQPSIHWLHLGFFDPAAELDYLAEHRKRSVLVVRVGIVLGIFLYSIFGALDPLIIPGSVKSAWFIRYVIVVPCSLIALGFSFLRSMHRWIGTFWVVLGPIYGFGIMGMIHHAPSPGFYLYYAGLMLVCFYIWTALHMDIGKASLACAVIVAGYEIISLWDGIPIGIFISNNFFLLTANIIGLVACYSMNLSERKDFLLRRQIQDQAKHLQAALEQVRALRGLLPLCAWCNRIRDNEGEWSSLLDYIPKHSEADFTHGICPECRCRVFHTE